MLNKRARGDSEPEHGGLDPHAHDRKRQKATSSRNAAHRTSAVNVWRDKLCKTSLDVLFAR